MIDFVSTLIVRFTDYKSLHTTHIPSLVYDLWMKLDQISLLKFSFPEKAIKICAICLMVWTFTK